MPRYFNLIVIGSATLFLSFLLGITPFQTTDDLHEVEQPPTTCSVPVVAPSFNTNSVKTHNRSKGQVDIEVAIHLQHPGIVGLNNQVEYNVTLRPLDDWYSPASKVVTGQVTVEDRAVVSASFSILKQNAITEKSWELEVYADAGPNTGRNSGLDRVYLSFLDQHKDSPTAVLHRPAEYWHAKTRELQKSNFTLPGIEPNHVHNFQCDNTTWISAQSFRPPPDIYKLPRFFPISIEVVYEDPDGVKRGLANARVEILADASASTPPWRYTLNDAGRANGVIVASARFPPVAAKLYLDDTLFSMKRGTTDTNLALWQYDLNFAASGGSIIVTGDLIASIGPYIGHVWSEFHRIRSGGEAMIGLSGVPHIDVWFPCSGPTCDPVCDSTGCTRPKSYYKIGQNRIALYSAHAQQTEVLSHEYGHHVMQSLMPGGIPPDARKGDHQLCSTNANDAMAFVEGYPTAFGLKVSGQRTFYSFDLEALSCPDNRNMLTSEGRVAAGMLDLMDVDVPAECSGGDDTLGRPYYCDRTNYSLFTPFMVLRQSITGASFASITAWWTSLSASLKGRPGIADGWETMRYNYYSLPPCRVRRRGICLDNILWPRLPWLPPRWKPGPFPPRVTPWPFPTPRPGPLVEREEL